MPYSIELPIQSDLTSKPWEDSLSALTPDNIATNTLFDATFSSLFVNWNPKAITQMLQSLTRFASYLERKS